MTFSNPAGAAATAAQTYVRALLDVLGRRDPVEVLDELLPWLAERIRGLDDSTLRHPEAPRKWSVIEVVQQPMAEHEVGGGDDVVEGRTGYVDDVEAMVRVIAPGGGDALGRGVDAGVVVGVESPDHAAAPAGELQHARSSSSDSAHAVGGPTAAEQAALLPVPAVDEVLHAFVEPVAEVPDMDVHRRDSSTPQHQRHPEGEQASRTQRWRRAPRRRPRRAPRVRSG